MIAHGKDIKVFCGNANPKLAQAICKEIGIQVGNADATAFAKETGFPVGVHVTLNSDDKKDLYPSLTGARSLGEKGLWHESKNLTFKARRMDVRAELELQYRYITDKGARVDHADSHCGTVYGINGRRFFLDAFDFCNLVPYIS